ncbi:MAG: hypothetical protein NC307_07325 [Roseburia sp.]|nr:hypothetical protein [Roseburia sp.]
MKAETDTEVCRVADLNVKEKVMYALMKAGVPYAEEWEKVSVMKRKRYNGAKEICVIITHLGKAELAKKVIQDLGDEIGSEIFWPS